MNKKEKERRKAKARRQTIFFKDGSLKPPTSETKRTICNVHLILAKEISKLGIREEKRKELLKLTNEAYNLGKRMDNKLDIYRYETGRDLKAEID